MPDMMQFPDSVEEFMERYKIVDTDEVYTNGAELVPIFRMKQWFAHVPERKVGKWKHDDESPSYYCSHCGHHAYGSFSKIYTGEYRYCPFCGAEMEGEEDD